MLQSAMEVVVGSLGKLLGLGLGSAALGTLRAELQKPIVGLVHPIGE